MARRGRVLVFVEDAFLQSFCAVFVLCAALYAQLQYKPYARALLNRVEELALAASAAAQMLCLLYYWLEHEEGGRHAGGAAEAAATAAWPEKSPRKMRLFSDAVEGTRHC